MLEDTISFCVTVASCGGRLYHSVLSDTTDLMLCNAAALCSPLLHSKTLLRIFSVILPISRLFLMALGNGQAIGHTSFLCSPRQYVGQKFYPVRLASPARSAP